MAQVNPGEYEGFKVEELAGSITKVVTGKGTTYFNANGFEIEEPKQAAPQSDPDEKKAPAGKGEKSWTDDLRTR